MPVYLDHNATTPLDERALEAMLPYLRGHYGNPSSVHRFGRLARAAVETAREQVAALVNAHPTQVIFTGGGTEANNLAIKGVAAACRPGRLAIGATEHPSVAKAAAALTRRGWRRDILDVDSEGRVVVDALAPGTALVSVMLANNETGVIQDIAAVGAAARRAGAILHTDAVQAAGKINVDFAATGAQLLSLSAHKLYGPKGVGALIVDKAVEIEPLLSGGGQEQGRRAGTENVAGIVGFGAAAMLARERLDEYGRRMPELRRRLEAGLRALGGIEIFSARAERLPNTVGFGARGVDGETLLMGLDQAGMAVASGAACSSGSREPSPVLRAMGIERDLARGAIRVSLGHGNTEDEMDAFVAALAAQLARLRPPVRRAAG